MITPPPTQSGFLAFVRNQMQINSTVLPDNSDSIATAFQVAMELANQAINAVSPVIYTVMVYNLAGANLINFAIDVQPPVIYQDGLTYFEFLRKQFGLTSFVGGTVASTSDEGTSESLNVPRNLENLTTADLQLLKTPWGRVYLQYAEQYGTIWGIS